MEFIIENSTWIIIFAVILVMTLIGYIADKSNFIENRKEKERNKKEQVDKEKKGMKTKKQQEFDAEIGDGSDLIMEENNMSTPVELDRPEWKIDIPVNEENNSELLEENNTFDFDMELTDSNSLESSNPLLVDEDGYEENKVNEENLNQELENINNSNDINEPLQGNVLNLDLYDNEQNVKEKDNEENTSNDNSIEMPLPEIDSLNGVNDEDIWKF